MTVCQSRYRCCITRLTTRWPAGSTAPLFFRFEGMIWKIRRLRRLSEHKHPEPRARPLCTEVLNAVVAEALQPSGDAALAIASLDSALRARSVHLGWIRGLAGSRVSHNYNHSIIRQKFKSSRIAPVDRGVGWPANATCMQPRGPRSRRS